MKNLKEKLGLDVRITTNNKLILGVDLTDPDLAIRSAEEARTYFLDPESKSPADLYYMYRATCRLTDYKKIQQAGFRFDITVIPSGKIGQEFIKTIGHFHPYRPGIQIKYPEIYEIVSGQAFFILQNEDLNQIYIIHAKEGEKAVMLPGFGHVTVNAFHQPLVMSNWVYADFKSEYTIYKEHRGAAYYAIEKNNKINFIPNKNYKDIVKYKEFKPKSKIELAADFRKPMYQQGLEDNFEKLDYLKNPENYLQKLTVEYCYQQIQN